MWHLSREHRRQLVRLETHREGKDVSVQELFVQSPGKPVVTFEVRNEGWRAGVREVVQGRQRAEVEEVRLDPLRSAYEVADDPAGFGRDNTESLVECLGTGDRVGRGANAVEALGKLDCIERGMSLHDGLEAAEERARDVRFLDDAVVHDRFDAEMPFDPRDGIELDGH